MTYSDLPAPRSPRYRSLDMWRGTACLMIVLIHAANGLDLEQLRSNAQTHWASSLVALLLSRLGVGVTIFFVISGYCISATADSNRRSGAGCGQYFVRRIRRIFPPYWVLLAVCLASVCAAAALGGLSIFTDGSCRIPAPGSLSLPQWLGNLTLTEAWRYHLSDDANARLLLFGPAWSLCYEEQFYLVCGLLLFLAPRRFFGGIALVTLFTVAVAGLSFPKTSASLQYFFFDGRWLLFALGVLVYYIVNYAEGRRRNALVVAMALCVVATAALRYGLLPRMGDDEQRQRMFEYLVAAGFAFSLLLLHRWDGRITASRLLAPLHFCGKICYSLYLIHWPVTILITHGLHSAGVRGVWPTFLVVVPLATSASVVAGWLFYRFVERHFINQPVGRAPRETTAQPAAPAPSVAGVILSEV